ncbi:MAG TPA: hypothetical protein VFE31_04345 [Opitutaceae bacterium]|jgi:hypothetical protein|nr:hypothetical protein [Opitutaceae bacterium]
MSRSSFLPAYYVRAGADVTFSADGAGPERRFRWRCNDRDLPGAEGPTLKLPNVGTIATGMYSIVADDSEGETCRDVANLTVVAETRFTEFAARGAAGEGPSALLLGFVIDGAGAKGLLLRGRAASEASRPEITLIGTEPIGGLQLPPGADDATLQTRLATGGYSLRVADAGPARAGAEAAIRDLDEGDDSAATIVNASVRGPIPPAGSLELEFTLAGTTAGTVLIRGIGPALKALFGVGDALSSARLELRNADGDLVGANEDWRPQSLLPEAFARCGAFNLSADGADAALLLTIPAGSYCAALTAPDGHAGVGLIEVYQVPTQ